VLTARHVDLCVHVALCIRPNGVNKFVLLVDFSLEEGEDLATALQPYAKAEVIKDDLPYHVEVDLDSKLLAVFCQELEGFGFVNLSY
jgi:hypothetical protein